ncbi:potassium transporter TrkG [Vibrio sinaloensis]|nr:potassium transporter TrkG [Vibrio sinaloensis]
MGLDPITSISGAITAVANVGPGMGSVIGPTGNFAPLPDAAKWILSLGMLMGRLEILTLLVLFFSPLFLASLNRINVQVNREEMAGTSR